MASLVVFGAASLRAENEVIETGAGRVVFRFSQQGASKPITIWTYRPKTFSSESKILFIMHGMERQPRRYLDPWFAHAERVRSLLLAPEFSSAHFPGGRNYNLGGMRRDSKSEPLQETGFSTIDRIFDRMIQITGNKSGGYLIYGHSAGAQFVHRLLLFHPEAHIDLAVAANAGWYTMPDFDLRFPYGLKDSGLSAGALGRVLGKNLVVLLGEKDTDTNHATLSRTAGAMAQGRQRFERGQNFFRAGKKQAEELRVPFGWLLKTVPEAGHDNAPMSQAAASLLLP